MDIQITAYSFCLYFWKLLAQILLFLYLGFVKLINSKRDLNINEFEY